MTLAGARDILTEILTELSPLCNVSVYYRWADSV